jgi:DNA-binding HxlR family transcriptional regulator
MNRTDRLALLFHRRWAVPVLAELHRSRGAKFVTLTTRLDASPGAVRAALDHLQDLGWVGPNPGYGHPLRPEYILTPDGKRIAEPCDALDRALVGLDLRPVGLRKWSMPTLDVLRAGSARFGEIRGALAGITDRALSMALGDLLASQLAARSLVDGAPPSARYGPTGRATRLCAILADL